MVKIWKCSCFITLRFKISSLVWNKPTRSVSILQNTDENAIDFLPKRSSTDFSDIFVSSMDFSKYCNLKPKFLLIDSALSFASYKRFRRLIVSRVRLSQAEIRLFEKIQQVFKFYLDDSKSSDSRFIKKNFLQLQSTNFKHEMKNIYWLWKGNFGTTIA